MLLDSQYSRYTGSGEIRCSASLILNGAQHSQKEVWFHQFRYRHKWCNQSKLDLNGLEYDEVVPTIIKNPLHSETKALIKIKINFIIFQIAGEMVIMMPKCKCIFS